jgi:hypothetical protein
MVLGLNLDGERITSDLGPRLLELINLSDLLSFFLRHGKFLSFL